MKTAKIFTTGRSQAVRLPAEFRFDSDEVFIRRDSLTGNVILSQNEGWNTWAEFFEYRDDDAVPADFMSDRLDAPPQKRESIEQLGDDTASADS